MLLAAKDFDAWLGGTLGANALRPAVGERVARMAGQV
jgi:hypothetical protein